MLRTMILLRAFAFVFSISSLHAATPKFEWVAAGGGEKSDKTRAVAFDREGNVFLAGETTGDGVFGDLKRTGLGSTDFSSPRSRRRGASCGCAASGAA